ncbi:MAG: universal stress protein [Gammaproteobacteria bacterium]|nr:universal stress protein [Gammaproteobacteria bacterium]
MFKVILLATDGSENGQYALDMAINLQKIHDSDLIILSVYHLHTMWKASVSMVSPELTDSTDAALAEYAKEVAEKSKLRAVNAGVSKVRSFYVGGGPAREIIRFSKEYSAELIVVGSRGLSDSNRHLLGSVSHKVTSLAECPVLIV